MHRLVDEGDAGDEYNFSPTAVPSQPAQPVRALASKVLEPGPLRGRLEARFDLAVFSGLSPDRRRRGDAETLLPVRLILSIEADTPRIDVELEVTNRATDHRLRVHCPLPFPATTSASDTPYHVTRRPAIAARRDPGAPEVELPTYPVWSFVDISDGNIGVALITDGLHEYEVIPGAPPELALTLLRSVGWLSRDDLSTRTGHAGPGLQTPGAQMPGVHRGRLGPGERLAGGRVCPTASRSRARAGPRHSSADDRAGAELHPDDRLYSEPGWLPPPSAKRVGRAHRRAGAYRAGAT